MGGKGFWVVGGIKFIGERGVRIGFKRVIRGFGWGELYCFFVWGFREGRIRVILN